ncbi:hypothetical protein ACFQ6V_23480 [Streptomyces roseifaciens]
MILSGDRTTSTAAICILTVGLAVVTAGVLTSDPARAAGGACFTVTALTLIALRVIRSWIVNTAAERGRLQDAIREAEAERTKCIAAQAAIEIERDRMRRDAAAAAQQAHEQLAAERDRMSVEFEEARGDLMAQTASTAFWLGVQHGTPVKGPRRRIVIPFPEGGASPDGPRPRGQDITRP